MEKKRKTGLGVDVFFAPAPGEEVQPPTETTEQPVSLPATPPQPEEKGPERYPKPKEARAVRKKAPKTEEPPTNEAGKPAMVKLTVMIRQDYFDRLEELKRRERRRLREQGEEKNWRQRVTITTFIHQALEEFFAKRGFK